MATTNTAETWDAIYKSGRAQRTWPSEDVIRFCARRLQPLRDALFVRDGSAPRVLEAGCGNGANLWFLGETYTTVGADCSNIAVADAYELTSNRASTVAIKQASLGTLRDNGVDGIFDALIDCRASQHTPWSQHAAIYREYCELLRPGGWLFLLHLDDATVDAKVNEHLRMPGPVLKSLGGGVGDVWTAEPYTWSDIERGVYPRNGVCCMPPADALRRLMESVGLAVDRLELLRREADDLVCQPVAIDARRPL